MKKTCFTFLATLAATVLSHAAPLFQEDFDALNAGTSIIGQNGWIRVAGDSTNAFVSNSSSAWSAANVLDLSSGTSIRNGFALTPLAESDLKVGFHFMPNTSLAGHNLEFALRSSTEQVFFLGLRGTRATLDVGTSNTNSTRYDFSSPLASGTWYYFEATIASSSNTLTFTITPSTGGSSLFTQSVTLTGDNIDRVYFSTTASTLSGDWFIDNVSINTIPESGTIAMILFGTPLILLGAWRQMKH